MMIDFKILLIDFQAYASKEENLYNNILSLPTGLMYLSSYIKKHLDSCEIKILKSLVDFKTENELLEILHSYKPQVIGIRGISVYIEELISTVSNIKNRHIFNGKIVIGGPIASSDTKILSDCDLFDAIVIGDGEEVFLEIIKSYIEKNNVCDQQDSLIKKGYIDDINKIPFPDYTTIDLNSYKDFIGFTYNRNKHGSILTSRGCPYKCIYCHNIFGKKARLRSPENVMDEINFLHHTHGIKSFCIIDDAFNIDHKRSMQIFNKIVQSNLKIKLFFSNGIRGDIANEEYIDAMVEAGTILVTFAVETVANKLQKLIRKNLNLDKITENIKYTCNKNILVNVFYMIGFPTETLRDAIDTLEYANKLNLVTGPILNFVKYYKGTELYNLAKSYGFTDQMIQSGHDTLYNDPSDFHTPTITNQDFKKISRYFVYKIVGNQNRVNHTINVLKKHFNEKEMMDYINFMHPFQSSTVDEFMKMIKIVNRMNKNTQDVAEYFV